MSIEVERITLPWMSAAEVVIKQVPENLDSYEAAIYGVWHGIRNGTTEVMELFGGGKEHIKDTLQDFVVGNKNVSSLVDHLGFLDMSKEDLDDFMSFAIKNETFSDEDIENSVIQAIRNAQSDKFISDFRKRNSRQPRVQHALKAA